MATTQAEPAANGGLGADHVLEAIGLTQTVELAISLTRPGGTTTLVGMTPQQDRAAIDVYGFVEDGRRLLGLGDVWLVDHDDEGQRIAARDRAARATLSRERANDGCTGGVPESCH